MTIPKAWKAFDRIRNDKSKKQPLVIKLGGEYYIKLGGEHFDIKSFEFYSKIKWTWGPLHRCKFRDDDAR
jgi:hypothetical protein